MSIITKTEICDNVPASLPSLSFQTLIGDMKRFESLSNEKIMALEGRLQAAEEEAKSLRRRNEELKSSLAAKERDCKLYYDQYQNIAAQFEEFKAKIGKDDELPKLNVKQIEADIEPAIVVEDTDSENEDNHDETILFTSPELFIEPATLEKPIPKANSTELPLKQPVETGNEGGKLASETAPTKTSSVKELSLAKATTDKNKRPVAKARKRAMSESHVKSGAPPKKTPKIFPTPTHFKCRECPKASTSTTTFQQIDEYREHIKETHPACKYLCDFCAYATDNATNMARHIARIHTQLYNSGYECKLCAVSFMTRGGLGKHLKAFH